jgi:hypothetical protein
VLEDQVRELLAVGFEQLIIDLRGLSFMDVSGCGYCSVSPGTRVMMTGGYR